MKKERKRILSVVLFMILYTVIPQKAFAMESGPLTDLVQNVYNDQNGLPTSEANTILQTGDGYIWIGGYGGLVRYGGNEFFNCSVQDIGLTSSGIRALFEDSKGNLWVGTNDKGVFLYENGFFTACTGPDETSFRSIRCFTEDSTGTIFVGTSTGLAQIGTDNHLVPVETKELKGQAIYSLSVDKNGVLWGTNHGGGVFAMKDAKLLCLLEPGDLHQDENYTVLADGDMIYIGTGGSTLLRLVLTNDQYSDDSFQVDVYDTGSLHTINALCLTDTGELWLGSNTGSGWFDASMELHTLNNMEQNEFIECIMQDYEGNLWFASTHGGVFQLAHGKFQKASKAAGLSAKSVNAVVQLDGLLYIASDNGLCIADRNWASVENDLTRQLNSVRIRHLCVDDADNLWISSYGDLALVRYTPATGQVLSFTETDGLLSNKVREVIQLQNGDMAVASTAGVNIIRGDSVIESYGQEQGLDNPVVLCLLQTADGTLLAGSDGAGIYTIADKKVANFGKEQGLTSGVVLRMREDKKAGGVWISAGNELYFMGEQGQVREITEFNSGIGSIFDILVMEDDIWIMKSSGVIIVPRAALLGQEKITATQYGRESGLTASLTANSWHLYEDGILYLCSADGVFLLDQKRVEQSSVPSKIAVNSVTVQRENGETTVYQNPTALTLPHDTRRITIRFASLSFAGVPVTLQYHLENFEDHFTSVSMSQADAVSYTNLRGGDYVFHLSAESADGVAAERTLQIPITKELRFIERPVVRAGLAVLAVLMGILVVKLVVDIKTSQLKRRQQEYKDITNQALRTIANTIDAKDAYTKGHSIRVAGYSRELARRLGLSENEQEKVYYMALLHDIGKIGIPDAILNKPGKLTDEEFKIMQEHTRIGYDILKDFTTIPQIGDGALSHHENYDGSGYPNHKQNEDIPLVARIIRVADSYDAMSTQRAYRDAMSIEYILSEFKKFSNIQFEPQIARLMTDMIEQGYTVELENGEKTAKEGE